VNSRRSVELIEKEGHEHVGKPVRGRVKGRTWTQKKRYLESSLGRGEDYCIESTNKERGRGKNKQETGVFIIQKKPGQLWESSTRKGKERKRGEEGK